MIEQMMQVHRDMVCSKCNSINEHEQVTKCKDLTNGELIEMIIRCKKCGHEYIQSTMNYWFDHGSNGSFKVTDWSINQIDLY